MFWMSTSCFLGTITLLVVTWFPAGERTTATGFIVAVQMVGLVPPAILFPQIVEDPGQIILTLIFGGTQKTLPFNIATLQKRHYSILLPVKNNNFHCP